MRKKLQQIRVDEFTSTDPVIVTPGTPLVQLLQLLKDNGFRHLPVVQEGRVVGIVSDRDLLLSRFADTAVVCAEDIMSREPYCVCQSDSLESVVFELSKRKFGSAIVLDVTGKLFGIFTVTDALNALIEVLRGEFPES